MSDSLRTKRQLPIFDGRVENWRSWKIKMRATMRLEKGMLAAIDKADEEKSKDLDAFEKLSGAAYSLIVLSLHDSCLKFISTVPDGDGVGAWTALCKEFERDSKASKRKLLRALFALKMGASESVTDYLFRLHRITEQLTDSKLDDDIVLTVMLGGLDARFATLVTIIDSTEKISLERAKTLLKEHDERHGLSSTSVSPANC